MLSVRQAAGRIGLSGDFSVLHEFFGHNSVPRAISLRTQSERLAWKRVDLNLIRVGSDQFTWSDVVELDRAVADCRDFFAAVNLAVGRVYHWDITTSRAGGAEHINNDDEAIDLCDDFSIDNSALDVFFVLTYAGSTIGYSAVCGPCDKDSSKAMEGSVVAIEGSVTDTGFVLAHEVAHYLGLEHTDSSSSNLMFPSIPNGGNLTSSQGSCMREHCFVRG